MAKRKNQAVQHNTGSNRMKKTGIVILVLLHQNFMYGMDVRHIAHEVAQNLAVYRHDLDRDTLRNMLVDTIRMYRIIEDEQNISREDLLQVLQVLRENGTIDENLEDMARGDLVRESEQDDLVMIVAERIIVGYQDAPPLTDIEGEGLLVDLLQDVIHHGNLDIPLQPQRLEELLRFVGIEDDRRDAIIYLVLQREGLPENPDPQLRVRIVELVQEVAQLTEALQRAHEEFDARQNERPQAAPIVIQLFEGEQPNVVAFNFNLPHLNQDQLARLLDFLEQRALNEQRVAEEHARNERYRVRIQGLVGQRGILGNFVLFAEQLLEGFRLFNQALQFADNVGMLPVRHQRGPIQRPQAGHREQEHELPKLLQNLERLNIECQAMKEKLHNITYKKCKGRLKARSLNYQQRVERKRLVDQYLVKSDKIAFLRRLIAHRYGPDVLPPRR